MVTIKDIAAATGVSATTVSNVINGKAGRVSAETINKINTAIKELGYVPNMSAKSLVSRSSKVIGFVNHILTTKNSNFMEDPFLSKLIGILEYELREAGYFLMLRTVETPEEFEAFLRNWNLDGLFLTGIFNDSFFDAVKTSAGKIPTVLVDSYVHHPDMCNVGLDDFGGSKMSTKYLIDKGHRKIAFATLHIKDGGVLMERFLGYKSALAEAGIKFDPSLVFECSNDTNQSYETCKAIAARKDVTGIVTTADFLAGNLISNFHHLGVRIPEDISIVGFDDLNICNILTPRLTTVHQDTDLKGRTAVNFMLELLEHKKPNPSEINLTTSITERESVIEIKR